MRAIKTEICNFTVPGRAIPAVRMTQRSKFTPRARRYLAYKNQVAWTAKAGFKGKITSKPVELNAKFYIHGNRRGDLDNLYKSIADGLNKVVYKDDRQVISMNAQLFNCEESEQRVEVNIHEIESL